MNKTQAFAAAAKLLGIKPDRVGIRFDSAALVGDDRIAAIEAARTARAAYVAAKEARDARRLAVLSADAEYQRLKAAAVAAEAAEQQARSRAYGRRVTIVRLGSIFNEHVADGDNYADAIEELKRKRSG